MKKIINRTVARSLLPISFTLLAAACGGGSSSSNDAPTADAGPEIRARFGSEITLSGRDSYDNDGPILNFTWKQVTGPAAELAVVSPSAVKFTVPSATQNTDLVFELMVEDNGGKTATDRVTVSAVGPVDLNRFLTYFNAPDEYVVEVALDSGVAALVADVDFDLVMNVTQRYQTQDGTVTTRLISTETNAGTWTAAQQANNTYPRFSFDIPSARIEDLVDVNKALRNNIDLMIEFELQNVTAAVDYVIQVLDNEGSPIALNDIAPAAPLGLNAPTPNGISVDTSRMLDHLGYTLAESKTTALAYYAAIDPTNEKTTLSDWLTANGYDEAKATRARYLNGFDLAFGRDMRMWSNEQGHVFAFVENYPNVDAMVDGSSHFGTVAMEYSPGPSGGEPFTKFYTFIRDPISGEQKRVVSMDFDGRGEKFTPGNCSVCHGGTPSALVAGEYPNEGNIGAGFLLWDVDTFAFSDAAYEGRTPFDNENFLNRADYEAAFKTFNQMVKLTNITDAQRDLVHGWYGGEAMPNAVFDGSYIPVAWRSPADGGPDSNPDNASTFYQEVFAPTCRACHNGLETPALQFASYSDFISQRAKIVQRVFDEGTMPMARVTMDNFWVGTQAEVASGIPSRAQLLAEHLSVDIDSQKPGAPDAVISTRVVSNINNTLADASEQAQATVLRGDRIELSALNSLFADSYVWSLTPPAGSGASLSQAQEASTSFVTDTHGDYGVDLTITNAAGVQDQVSYTYQVMNRIPVAGDFTVSTRENETVDINVLTGDTQLGDGELADHDVVSTSNEFGGSALIGSGGVISFTPVGVGTRGFDYQIADIDGDESELLGSVSIEVTALPSASNDSVSASVGTQSTTRATAFAEASILANDNLGSPETNILNTVTRISSTLTNGLGSCSSTQGSMVYDALNDEFDYTPPVGCVGTEVYEYTIEDSNADQDSGLITVTVNRTSAGAFSNMVTAISLVGCAGCHDGNDYGDGAVVMDLSGSDASKFTQLLECNVNPASGDCGEGARINTDTPSASLILQKVVGNEGHGGGAVVQFGDDNYNRILRWIEEGVAAP